MPTNPLKRLSKAFSVGGDVPYGNYSSAPGQWPFLMPNTRIDYKHEAGDLTQQSIIMACINVITRTFPEAPFQVMSETIRGDDEEMVRHPLTLLIKRPNPYYNGLLLWQATLISLNIDGNGYWLKARNPLNQTVQLWYEPHTTIQPVWPQDGSEFITGYQIRRHGQWYFVDRAHVVHFRNGIDPMNPRLGLSPLASAMREAFTDNEAANFSASLLRNFGVPGLVVSPTVPDFMIDDPEGLKNTLMAQYGGDRRGEPLVIQGPVKVEHLSFSPTDMNLEALRNIPEERISALLGVPAMIVGLGAGLERSTLSNYAEAREALYHQNLIPAQRMIAAQADTDLLPEFAKDDTEYCRFDISHVAALAEDEDKRWTRTTSAFKAGVVKRGEAKKLLGLVDAVDPKRDDVYIHDLIQRIETISDQQQGDTPLPETPQGDPPGDDPNITGETDPGEKWYPAPDHTNARSVDDILKDVVAEAFGTAA